MFNWIDKVYVNARKKIFKNLDTGEILNLELQDDPDNVLKESDTPLTAHCLNMAQQELVDDMSKTYTGTNITAPTVKGRGRNNKVYGFCRQKKREGKNRIGFNDCNFTLNGVTVTVKDGVITLNGTCTADNTGILNLDTNKFINTAIKVGNSLSAFYKSGSMSGYCKLRLFDKDFGQALQLDINLLNSTTKYIKTNSDISFTFDPSKAGFRINKDATFNNFSFMCMLTDNEDSTYEAYGASPSPNFLSAIHSLGDDKQLFDGKLELGNISANTGESIASTNNVRTTNFQAVKPNTTYTLSNDMNYENNLVYSYNESKQYIEPLPVKVKEDCATFTTKNNTCYIKFRSSFDKMQNNLNVKYKLQQGTVATPWSPFGYGTVVNKSETINKLNLDKLQVFNGKQYVSTVDYGNKGSILLKKNTIYTVVSDIKFYDCGIFLYDENGAGGRITTTVVKDKYIYKFNSGNNNSLGFYIGGFEGTSGATTFDTVEDFSSKTKVMLLEGEYTAANLPDYVLHEEDEQVTRIKEPLLGTEDVQDELDYSKGTIIRRFAKIIFNGTETGWNMITSSSNNTVSFYKSRPSDSVASSTNLYSNCFVANANYTNIDNSIYIGPSNLIFSRVLYNGDYITTVEDWKAFLAEQYANGTPVEVIYELATPIIEDIDCSDKIAQFDGQTTIYNTDGAELECTLTNNRAIAQTNENLNRIEKQQSSLQNYSTEEQIIGKWIDGKPIYRKVISGNAPAPDSNGVTWYNITNNVQDLVNVYGNISQRPYNYILISRGGSYCPAFDVVVNSNTLQYRNLGVAAGYSYQITLEYTKTTD